MITFNMVKRMQKRRGHFYCHKNISSVGERVDDSHKSTVSRRRKYVFDSS